MLYPRTTQEECFTFAISTKQPLKRLLLVLGHHVFENWEEVLPSEKPNNNSNGNNDVIFCHLSKAHQIHLLTNFIVNYVSYDVAGSVISRVPTNLFSKDSTEKTPLSPNRLTNVNHNSVISETYFDYDESKDLHDSLPTLHFLMMVLKNCIQNEICKNSSHSQPLGNPNISDSWECSSSISSENGSFSEIQEICFPESCEHEDLLDSSCTCGDFQTKEGLQDTYWRELLFSVYRELSFGIEAEALMNNEDICSTDVELWSSLIHSVSMEFLKKVPSQGQSIPEPLNVQIKRMKAYYKKKYNSDLVQHDMCKLQFLCQTDATLFQSSFRITAQRYLKSIISTYHESKTVTFKLLEKSREFPFLNVCYWHNEIYHYNSCLDRIKAFHRVVDKSPFPIQHLGENSPAIETSWTQKSIKRIKELLM